MLNIYPEQLEKFDVFLDLKEGKNQLEKLSSWMAVKS